jgi:hypothetical protein
VESRRVLDNNHVLALDAGDTERRNCGRRVRKQPSLITLVDPLNNVRSLVRNLSVPISA